MDFRIYIMTALLLSFGACKNSQDHNHDEGHQHEILVEMDTDAHADCDHDHDHKAEQSHQAEETHTHAQSEEHSHENEKTSARNSENDHNHTSENTQSQKSIKHDGHHHTSSEITTDGQEHSDVKFSITSYSETFEVFAEADPFSIEKASSILAHFTWLDNFKPLTHGTVKAVLKMGNEVVENTQKRPLREGIYRFDLVPKKAGNAQLSFIIETEGKIYRIESPQQTVFADNEDAISWALAQEANSVNSTVFTKEQSWKVGFRTQTAELLSFGKIIKTTALTKPCVAGEAIISATSNGIVDLQSHHITDGMQVKKGEELFVISGNQLANNNSTVRFIEAKNNYERARSNYERAVELEKDKIVTTKELIDAKNEYENTKVIYENLQENFSSQGQVIKSPIDGYINNLRVGNGEYVEAGYPLMGITKNQRLVLNADIQQKYASILPQIYSATIRTVHNNRTYSLEELNGHILSYGKTTNSNNYLIPIALEIDNTDDFVAGGFVELYLKYKSASKSIVVPKTALLEEQGNFFVFVQVHPELFEKREVKIGATDGQNMEITSGLKANERIVSSGAILIKLAQSTGALDAHSGHVH